MEIANTTEPAQDGRVYIELINARGLRLRPKRGAFSLSSAIENKLIWKIQVIAGRPSISAVVDMG
jgi:hypothetical protein